MPWRRATSVDICNQCGRDWLCALHHSQLFQPLLALLQSRHCGCTLLVVMGDSLTGPFNECVQRLLLCIFLRTFQRCDESVHLRPLEIPHFCDGLFQPGHFPGLRQPWHLDPHERTPLLVLGPLSTRLQSLSWQQIPWGPKRPVLLPNCGLSLKENLLVTTSSLPTTCRCDILPSAMTRGSGLKPVTSTSPFPFGHCTDGGTRATNDLEPTQAYLKSQTTSCTDRDSPRRELLCVPRGQQPPALHSNRACCPNDVAMRSRHFCGALQEHHATWLGTKRSGTCKSRRTNVLPPHHPGQPDDIFRFPPTTPGKFGLCFLASISAAPSMVAVRALAVPSLLRALTRVTSMASSAPPDNGRPFATISRRRPSNLSKS